MIEGLKDGKSLHDSFHQLKFHQDMLSYLFYAEQHGDISFALQQGSALLYKKDKYRKDMMKIMQYPMFLMFFLLIMLFILTSFYYLRLKWFIVRSVLIHHYLQNKF